MQRETVQEVKVVLLGKSGVGKSSIFNRYINQTFDPYSDSTLGVAFSDKEVEYDGAKYKMKIWDTAGQEKFKALAPLYYKDAHVAIIVYDITDLESFKELAYWVKEVREKNKQNPLIFIVGNKLDMVEKEKIKYNDALIYARSVNASLILTSAKENKSINDLFTSILEGVNNFQKVDHNFRLSMQRNPNNPNLGASGLSDNNQQNSGRRCCGRN